MNCNSVVYNKSIQKLYKSIWEPISSLIHVDDCIYFSPVGMLSLIPMEILQDSLGINAYITDTVLNTNEIYLLLI